MYFMGYHQTLTVPGVTYVSLNVALLPHPAGTCGLQHRAFLALASGQSSKAAELFQEALKLDPTNIGCATNMALSELYNRQLPKAVEALEIVQPFPCPDSLRPPNPSALRKPPPPLPRAAGCLPRIPRPLVLDVFSRPA